MEMFKRKYFGILTLTICSTIGTLAQPIDKWKIDEAGLPCIQYTANNPSNLNAKKKTQIAYSDAYFLLGNYNAHVLTYTSGNYQILTSERTWSRMNQADNNDENGAGIVMTEPEKTILLTGKGSLAENEKSTTRLFGIGFAQYQYNIENQIACSRVLSVKPSTKPNEGTSAFVIKVRLTNTSAKALKFTYFEYVKANYAVLQNATAKHKIDYTSETVQDKNLHIVRTDFKANPLEPFLWNSKEQESLYEGFPASLFMKAVTESEKKATINMEVVKDAQMKDRLTASFDVELKPKQEKEFQLIIGYTFDNSFAQIEAICNKLTIKNKQTSTGKEPITGFSAEWKNSLPKFENEVDTNLRREILWNAYTLEASAAYNQYFGETTIPQGTAFDNISGQTLSAKDQLQSILPLCYYNKPLAKSALRYALHKMDSRGIIPANENGYGWLTDASEQTDNSLYFLSALAEYVHTSGDTDFLLEELNDYPRENTYKTSILKRVEQSFLYFRDNVGTGMHGLTRTENGESLTSTAQTIKSMGDIVAVLIPLLDNQKFAARREHLLALIDGMRVYRFNLVQALLKDWGQNNWVNQGYSIDNKATGAEKMDIATQALVLQIPEISLARKQALWSQIEKQLTAATVDEDLILGVNTFDKAKAWELFAKMNQGNLPKPDAKYSASKLYSYFILKYK